jgi:hypothetical protein
VHISRRRASFNRSDPPSRRTKLPSSVSARLGRRRKANSSRSTLHWRRRGPLSSSGMLRSRGSPRNWSRKACRMRSCDWLARRRTPLFSSCSERRRLRARRSRQRRSRLRVSCPSQFFCLSLGFVEIRSRLICFFTFRPTNGSRDVSDPGQGDPDGL